MYQIIFIQFININQNNFNLLLEIEKLSSYYKFTIKKLIYHLNAALIQININNILFLQQNTNIIIINEDDLSYTNELNKYLQNKKK